MSNIFSPLYLLDRSLSPKIWPSASATERHEIDWIQITAGKWKRTVDPLSEITEEQRAKAQEDVGAPRLTVGIWGFIGS